MGTLIDIIGPHDLWLAATCIAHSHSLATANVREFQRISGLVVEDWTRMSPPTGGAPR